MSDESGWHNVNPAGTAQPPARLHRPPGYTRDGQSGARRVFQGEVRWAHDMVCELTLLISMVIAEMTSRQQPERLTRVTDGSHTRRAARSRRPAALSC
ncbi:hypothetical protein FRUB_06215 [Fimbriiglobus ruber]|uniref:Uncharacterized protein n=1 Tax=Fimbriiglobus ruber TaxID=1908690 RepID=A0A225DDS2_9BACT|nr:hypothetical protein FRUB_06215 [Fimbriiglobus ruber]